MGREEWGGGDLGRSDDTGDALVSPLTCFMAFLQRNVNAGGKGGGGPRYGGSTPKDRIYIITVCLAGPGWPCLAQGDHQASWCSACSNRAASLWHR
ncbi:hypothetical protein E2C01_088668 [Portunus trituberculatus]|uniref:Uncharacterized protein n=1 Tax=Portunus trituberculatus TaxID=210409 RepID=A0A5B7JG30_PORTR|nr:hypothetical protein [Portunus trituberculatus]